MAEIQESGGKGDGKKRAKKSSGKPDMTPMVDLGFLLITFFMYTTTFGKPNIMKLNMPDKEEDDMDKQETMELKESNTITIVLGKEDRVFWYQKALTDVLPEDLEETDYTAEGIRAAILKKKANAPNPENFTVIIKPTADANWKNTVDILDEMAITACDKFAIVDVQKVELDAYTQKVSSPKSN
ncbi:MAG: ExbD/TolR family protein [Spirosomataceae bacterium]